MKINKLLISLLLFSLFPSLVEANACETGHSWSIAYILRDENRCEGLLDRPVAGNSLPDLISFATSNLTEYPNNLLSIQVPGDSSQEPIISIQSFSKRYKLDKLKTEYLQPHFTFDLDTKKVLQHPHVKVSLESLRSLAFIVEDYELYLENSEGESRSFAFEHDPNWFNN